MLSKTVGKKSTPTMPPSAKPEGKKT